MSHNKQAKINLSKYERIKKKLLNNWIFVAIALLSSGIILGGNIVQSLNTIIDWMIPRLTIFVTVSNQSGNQWTLDVAINNNSDKSVILTSVKVIPGWVTGGIDKATIKVSGNYPVSLDSWHKMVMEASPEGENFASLLKAGRVRKGEDNGFYWVKPDPIKVKEISEKKFTVEKYKQERFQIHMGLTNLNYYLQGTVFLEIKTDNGITLRSKALKL